MDRTTAAGLAITLAGLVGYVLGVLAPYPGRGFSLTGLMVGLTLVAVGDWGGTREEAADTDIDIDTDTDTLDRERDEEPHGSNRGSNDGSEGRAPATTEAGP